MSGLSAKAIGIWKRVSPQLLPFADAATPELPLGRLLRLSLFQVAVGLAMALLTGTLNRVMIVELGVPAGLVAIMISLPLVMAPFRAVIGHRSDHHRSFLGLRRLPYMVMGSMLQYGGLAIMPFALLILSGDNDAPVWVGKIAASLAFVMTGAGVHICQTAGMALAADLAPAHSQPRVVALLYVMLLVGMVASSLALGVLLTDVTPKALIQVVQGCAVVVIVLNTIALWKQEARQPHLTRPDMPRPSFKESWASLAQNKGLSRLLVVVGLGTAAFSMQDILLEPYGGEVLRLSVGATTALTALLAGGSLLGFSLAAYRLARGADTYGICAQGLLVGIVAFTGVVLAGALGSTAIFRASTLLIGVGGGLFSVGTLTAAMSQSHALGTGLALGAWGAVQATANGTAMGIGGVLRDIVTDLAGSGWFGAGIVDPVLGYSVVYNLEIVLMFAALVAVGPLYRRAFAGETPEKRRFGLNELPG